MLTRIYVFYYQFRIFLFVCFCVRYRWVQIREKKQNTLATVWRQRSSDARRFCFRTQLIQNFTISGIHLIKPICLLHGSLFSFIRMEMFIQSEQLCTDLQ